APAGDSSAPVACSTEPPRPPAAQFLLLPPCRSPAPPVPWRNPARHRKTARCPAPAVQMPASLGSLRPVSNSPNCDALKLVAQAGDSALPPLATVAPTAQSGAGCWAIAGGRGTESAPDDGRAQDHHCHAVACPRSGYTGPSAPPVTVPHRDGDTRRGEGWAPL